MTKLIPHRQNRSYRCRETRLTLTQEKYFEATWPQYGVCTATQNPLNLEALFGRFAPCTLEIGFGDGASLLAMASVTPERDFIAVEVYRRGILQLLSGIVALKLSNIRIIFADAIDIFDHYIPNGSLDTVQIFFADPWPKTRHHKRRLVQIDFVNLISRTLAVGGMLHLATDWTDYAQAMMSILSENHTFTNLAGQHQFMPRPTFRPLTKYETRALREGRPIFDLCFQRIGL